MKAIPIFWFDHRTDLPTWLTAAIGRIAVGWSALERELEELIRLLMDAELRDGRMVTTGMNLRTRLLVARNFVQAHVYEKTLEPQFLADIIDLSTEISDTLEAEGNKVIHGLWARFGRAWYVMRTTGTRPVPEVQPEIKKLSRAVLPQREKMTAREMHRIARKVDHASQRVESLCRRLEAALPPLQHKPPEYTRLHRRRRARSK